MSSMTTRAGCACVAVALLAAFAGNTAEIEPAPLGAGMRPGSVGLPEPRLAPEPQPPVIQVPPGDAPETVGGPPAPSKPAAPAPPDEPAGRPAGEGARPR